MKNNESIHLKTSVKWFSLPSVLFYLVAVVFHQLKDKSSVHERQQVVEEERQADVDFLCLLYLLKQQQIKKTSISG